MGLGTGLEVVSRGLPWICSSGELRKGEGSRTSTSDWYTESETTDTDEGEPVVGYRWRLRIGLLGPGVGTDYVTRTTGRVNDQVRPVSRERGWYGNRRSSRVGVSATVRVLCVDPSGIGG